jgi:hypothetical protein
MGRRLNKGLTAHISYLKLPCKAVFYFQEVPLPLPLSFYSQAIGDNTKKPNGEPERTTFEIAVTTLTPANAAAQSTLMGNLSTAVAGLVIGRFLQNQVVYARVLTGTTPADSPLAQRENKWLCRYHDSVNFKKFSISIGTADLTLLADNSELLDLTTDPGLAFKTAFEAVAVSPDESTHTVVLDSVQFVGRNT